MLRVKRCVSTSSCRTCRAFLASDPVANVLVLGDVYEPLFRVSDVYVAYEGSRLTGACSIYRAFPTPSIVFSTGKAETKQALIEKALGQVSGDFISLCSPEDAYLFEKHATSLDRRFEQQMVARSTDISSELCLGVSRVKKCDLELLDRFYVDHCSEAWAPIQFEAGPYYCIKQDGDIVSAAGVHLVAPQIAQLGNIVTDKAYRNRGFAGACTSALAAALASEDRIISLFVRTDNCAAIHIYEVLGFTKKRDIMFLVMRKYSD